MIGAYFPCYNQLTAANEVVDAYRRHHPLGTLLMVNDAGDKRHQAIAEKYNCRFFYETENIGYPGGQKHHGQIAKWIKRFLHYTTLMDNDWFILLEDDVFTMNTVDASTLKYDINGINPGNRLPCPSVNIIKSRKYHTDATERLIYGAMGGAIFRTSFFRNLDVPTIMKDIDEFGEACPETLTGQNWYYSDVILSFICYLHGGTLGMYPQFAELWFADLGQRIKDNSIAVLNQYKFLYNYAVHPHLTEFIDNKYTIVLPTRGSGDAFELFVEHGVQRYIDNLDLSELHEFIIICPRSELEKIVLLLNDYPIKFTFYADEDFCTESTDGWMKQQLLKLAICTKIKTDYYFIIDDDLFLTKPLRMQDFFDSTGKIYYSFEGWPKNGCNYATNTQWWFNSCVASGIHPLSLVKSASLMGVTPQFMITRIVYQLICSMGTQWMKFMVMARATEFSMYWIYLIKTLRSSYYVPCNAFFAMDNECNILVKDLSDEEFKRRVKNGLSEKKYYFTVIQSWLKYPKDLVKSCLM